MALSFAFNPQSGETPETVARKRAIAEMLLGRTGRASNIGEGIGDFFAGIGAGIANSQANKSESSGRSKATEMFRSLLMGGFGNKPPTSGAMPSSSASPVNGGTLDGAKMALLNTIAGPESAGKYNVLYGGKTFDDMSRHPGIYNTITSGPNKGKKSSAAGKYQFLERTWDGQADKLGLKDFSPASQDQAAWDLAATTYRQKTGRDIMEALGSGDPNAIAQVGKVLSPIWTSLPSGIEQGTTTDKFVASFNRNFGQRPVQVASSDPQQAFQSIAPASIQPSVQLGQPPGGYTLADANNQVMGPIEVADIPEAPGAMPIQPQQMAPQPQQQSQALTPPPDNQARMNAILEALANPWLSQSQQSILGNQLEQMQQQADPMRQMQLQKMQLEMQKMQNPGPDYQHVGNTIVQMTPQGPKVVYDATPKDGEKTPQLVEMFDEATGQPYKAKWNSETKQFERVGGIKSPTGMTVRTNPDGSVEFQQGPLGAKGLNVDEAKNAGFLDRGMQSEKILQQFEQEGTSLGNKAADAVPWGMGNYLKTPQGRKYEQAKRDFINATLRRESGAVISDQEFENAERQYFPQPGDDPETIKQKRENRAATLRGFGYGAGRAKELVPQPSSDTPATSEEGVDLSAMPNPPDVDAETWKYMDNEARKLWLQ